MAFFTAPIWSITDHIRSDVTSGHMGRTCRFADELFSKVIALEAMIAKCNNVALPRINFIQ